MHYKYKVPHDVKNQRAIAKMTSQIMLRTDVNYLNENWY